MTDRLAAGQILKWLNGFPRPEVQVFEQIDSTQTYCQRHRLVKPRIVAADQQSRGHGQRGHRFYSPRASGIYITIVLPARQRFIRNPGILTAGVGVAVVQACRTLTGIPVRLKWMNDLEYHRRKCGGILVETNGNSVNRILSWLIGIGLNLDTQRFPGEISGRAGDLLDRRQRVSRNRLIAEIYDQLVRVLHTSRLAIVNQYRRLMVWRRHRVTFRSAGRLRSGIVLGIDRRARLLVEDRYQRVHHLNYRDAEQVRLA